MALTKADLAEARFNELGLNKREAKEFVELFFEKIREALENGLVPYKLMEFREMLLRAGFRYCDVFFKWYNFCGSIAVK